VWDDDIQTPTQTVLLWLSGLAIVVLPNYKAMQISWVFVSLLHALTSLAGIGHFLFLAIEYWDIMWHYMAMFIWSPLLQMLELMLLGSSIILMITVRLHARASVRTQYRERESRTDTHLLWRL